MTGQGLGVVSEANEAGNPVLAEGRLTVAYHQILSDYFLAQSKRRCLVISFDSVAVRA